MEKVLITAIAILVSYPALAAVKDDGSHVVWTAVFEGAKPQNSKTSQEYCDAHTPTVITTNIKQITSPEGVKALNGVTIRYLSYKSSKTKGLHFNLVKGQLSGIYKDKKWTQPIDLYEQTLEEVGKTYTVWATSDCKGIFTGYPTVVN